ncbi:hypothetical protein HZS_7722 [Henneguya salminicola]|nr:hypothetical protein HZS_7722 [Henneguya salminicola]
MLLRLLRTLKRPLIGRRYLNLQEFQCKNILAENSLVVQRFGVARDSERAGIIAMDLSLKILLSFRYQGICYQGSDPCGRSWKRSFF